jgi:hypothetical protein
LFTSEVSNSSTSLKNPDDFDTKTVGAQVGYWVWTNRIEVVGYF